MASVFASASRRSRLLAGAAAAALASCSALDVAPGSDFAVRILDPTPIPAVGKISVPVPIAVTGCADFHVAVSGDSGSRPVDVVRDGDGWVAYVPVAFLRGQDTMCLRGAGTAIWRPGRLDVTCADAGRTASAAFEISYATAEVFTDLGASGLPGKSLQYLFPSGDPLQPYAVSPSWMQPWAALDPGSRGFPFSVDASWQYSDSHSRPRLVADERGIFFTSGCGDVWETGSTCPQVEVAPGVVAPSERIWVLNPDPAGSPPWWYAWVPQHVTDIAVAADGALVVVSHARESDLGISSPYGSRLDTIVSRIAAGPPPAGDLAPAEIVGYFPEDSVTTRLSRMPDGRLAFLTLTHPIWFAENTTLVLNVTDGHTVERLSDGRSDPGVVIGGSPGAPSLSPDASLVLVGNTLGAPGASAWTTLPMDNVVSPFGDGAGAAWGPDVVATWKGVALGEDVQQDRGILEAFDLRPPNARLFRYDMAPLPGATGPATLNGVAVVGTHFVLTTSTGVRVLDRGGRIVAGSDPLPCRMTPSAVAIQTGPDQAAVGVGDHYVLVFDLSTL
jgi:hypothetical protein